MTINTKPYIPAYYSITPVCDVCGFSVDPREAIDITTYKENRTITVCGAKCGLTYIMTLTNNVEFKQGAKTI